MYNFLTADEMRKIIPKPRVEPKDIVFTDEDIKNVAKIILDEAIVKAENKNCSLTFDLKGYKGLYPDDPRIIQLTCDIAQFLRKLKYHVDVFSGWGDDNLFHNELVIKW